LSVSDSQLDALTLLRAEIEGIDRASRNPAATALAAPDAALSYSFGLFSSISPLSYAEQTVAEIVASVREVLAKLAPVATIETSMDGMTARTVVYYTGRAASVWSNAPSSELAIVVAGAHLDSLGKTYALRVAFVGAIGAVGGALASISLAVANPLTVLHALASAKALKQALDRLVAAVEAAA
jgi:hypothetical protein